MREVGVGVWAWTGDELGHNDFGHIDEKPGYRLIKSNEK